MSLPKLSHPNFSLTIPSSGKRSKFRPFVTREEKILFMAKQGEPKDVMEAVCQIVTDCSTEGLTIDQLAMFDVQYLFLKLRAASVNNVAKVAYRDNADDEVYSFDVDLDSIEVQFPEKKPDKVVELGGDVFMELQYPRATIYSDPEFYDEVNPDKSLSKLVAACVRTISSGDEIVTFSDYPSSEQEEFIDDLPIPALEKIREWIAAVPSLYYKIEYENSHGDQRIIELTTLTDFFILR